MRVQGGEVGSGAANNSATLRRMTWGPSSSLSRPCPDGFVSHTALQDCIQYRARRRRHTAIARKIDRPTPDKVTADTMVRQAHGCRCMALTSSCRCTRRRLESALSRWCRRPRRVARCLRPLRNCNCPPAMRWETSDFTSSWPPKTPRRRSKAANSSPRPPSSRPSSTPR